MHSHLFHVLFHVSYVIHEPKCTKNTCIGGAFFVAILYLIDPEPYEEGRGERESGRSEGIRDELAYSGLNHNATASAMQ